RCPAVLRRLGHGLQRSGRLRRGQALRPAVGPYARCHPRQPGLPLREEPAMKHRINPLRTALGLALALSVCGPLPVALAALAGPGSQVVESLPGDSLYQVQAALTDQHGQALQWPELRGQPRLVSMFYGNCHLMCPLILENAKALQKQLGAD